MTALSQAAKPPAHDTEAAMSAGKRRRQLVAASIGNVLEYYDFVVYAFLASTIATKFFPSENEVAALLASFAAFGVGFLPPPSAGLAETPLLFNLSHLAIVAVVTLLAYLALEHLSRSPWGRVLKALREDERAAISLGKSARFYRVQAFAVGGALSGLTGAVQAQCAGLGARGNYAPMLTFQVWVMLIVGGSGSNLGAVVGSVLVWAIWAGSGALTATLFPPEQQARAASLQIVAIGVMLCVILLFRPNGLFGNLTWRRRFGLKARKLS